MRWDWGNPVMVEWRSVLGRHAVIMRLRTALNISGVRITEIDQACLPEAEKICKEQDAR